MHRVAAEARVHFTDKVLDSDPAVLSLARRTAFYEIARRAEDYEHAIMGYTPVSDGVEASSKGFLSKMLTFSYRIC